MMPEDEFPIHSQADWELAYIVKGSGTALMGDETRPFSRGEIFLLPPNMRHGWIFDNHDRTKEGYVEDICLSLRKDLFDKLASIPELGRLNYLNNHQETAFRLHGNTLNTIKRVLSEMISADEREHFGQVMRIVHLLASSDNLIPTGHNQPLKKADEKIQQIDAYIPLHYNRDIPINDVASLVHMNRSSFCVFFKRMKGISFSTYLNTYRIDTACHLLATTDKSISEIAYNVGFNSPSHFSRTFRKIRKCAPLDYRNTRLR